MPSLDMRTCYDCGNEYDDTWDYFSHSSPYFSHFVECDAYGCGESYCPSNDVCTYCNGNGYSDNSDEDENGYGVGIHDYSYKPEPMWLGGEDQPYYLGFELEISASQFNTSPLYQWCDENAVPGMLYCKEDGSVDGFEIVSHPMTPQFFDSINWESFFNMLEEYWPCGTEPSGHGLHVHVSRTAFNGRKSTLARWSYMLNRYRDHVTRVARRRDSHWAQFTDYPVSCLLPYQSRRQNGHWEEGAVLACGCCHERNWIEERSSRICHQFQSRIRPERYQAVNLTNRDTVEVRVFRSTRDPEEFTAALHFVAATVDFVRTMQPWHATRVALAWETFADYVASHPVFSKQASVIAGVPAKPPAETVTLPARAVREWARAVGIPVGTRGRIPSHIQRRYIAASAI